MNSIDDGERKQVSKWMDKKGGKFNKNQFLADAGESHMVISVDDAKKLFK
jgi:hypothetical protein